MKLTKYIEGGIEPVLEASLRRFFDVLLGPAWRDQSDMKKLREEKSAFKKNLLPQWIEAAKKREAGWGKKVEM